MTCWDCAFRQTDEYDGTVFCMENGLRIISDAQGYGNDKPCEKLIARGGKYSVKEDWRMNLDRFSQGLPDPQDADVLAYCEGCGGEIYQGEEVYVVEGEILHAEWECLVRYIDPELKTIEEALG